MSCKEIDCNIFIIIDRIYYKSDDIYIKLYDINDYSIIENKLFTNIDNNFT